MCCKSTVPCGSARVREGAAFAAALRLQSRGALLQFAAQEDVAAEVSFEKKQYRKEMMKIQLSVGYSKQRKAYNL